MESIKKLEQQLMMNQRNCGSEKITNGPKDDGAKVTSNKEVVSDYTSFVLECFTVDKNFP